MSFVNCGAYVNGTRPKSKKALKDAIKSDPNSVAFDSTSMFDPNIITYNVSDLSLADITLQVCGPDPYNSRKWYASVTKTDKGIKVT